MAVGVDRVDELHLVILTVVDVFVYASTVFDAPQPQKEVASDRIPSERSGSVSRGARAPARHP